MGAGSSALIAGARHEGGQGNSQGLCDTRRHDGAVRDGRRSRGARHGANRQTRVKLAGGGWHCLQPVMGMASKI